ncbi:Zinc finger protein CONSTANS-LIKE 2, partial [Mucuna pruriens]
MSRKLGTATSSRACHTCPSAEYCLDSAFHAASLYERVRVCDSCARVPAAFLCSADAASLCASCDDDVTEAASWLVLNPEKNEECLEFAETENGFCDVSFEGCGVASKSYEVESVVSMEQQQVSISSTDVNIAPESTISEVSISHSNPAIGTTSELSSGPPILMPSYLTYREERVLRYREKKKKRKFEKKIRYASRKAYAEVRPRIKGRFAKRNNVEAEMDHMFSSTLITEAGYNILQEKKQEGSELMDLYPLIPDDGVLLEYLVMIQ